MKNSSTESPKRLLILCCHCVYHEGNIYSEFPEDKPVYEQHLRESIRALQEGHYDVLIVSGGFTKGELGKSEARGMLDWAKDLNLNTAGVLLEEYARDSFENVLFSMCRFFQEYKQFPRSVGVCSWKSKKRRFEIIADALRLPNYSFLGIGEKEEIDEREAKLLDIVIDDPLHCKPSLAYVRRKRDPWNKGNPYAEINEFSDMFSILDLMEGKGVTDHRLVNFPWASNKGKKTKEEKTIDQGRGNQWATVYEQHCLHARHVENERLWFTNVIVIVVAALLAGLTAVWRISGAGEPLIPPLINIIALVIPVLIIVLAALGCLMMIVWRAAFIEHSTLAKEMLKNAPELRKYIPYQSDEFQKIKWTLKMKIGKTTFHLFTAHSLFYLFFAALGASGSFVLANIVTKTFCWWQILVAIGVFLVFIIPWIRYEKREEEYNESWMQKKY